MIRACLVIASIIGPACAYAQPASDPVARLQLLALRYRECLVRVANEQRTAGADKDQAVEKALDACTAQEQAIIGLAEAQRVPPGRIKLTIAAIKQKMKQQVADDLR